MSLMTRHGSLGHAETHRMILPEQAERLMAWVREITASSAVMTGNGWLAMARL